MWKNNRNTLLWLAALLVGCSTEPDGSAGSPTDEKGAFSIGQISDNAWTYISLEKRAVVGQSAWGNTSEDSLWAQRLDWDFALCGKHVRTNGGKSGIGKGGVIIRDTLYRDE